MDDCQGFRTSAEEVTADAAGRGRGEAHLEPADGTESLQSQDHTLMDELIPMVSKESIFLEMDSIPEEGAANTVEMTPKDLNIM